MKQFYFFSIAIVFLLLSQNSWGQVKLGDNPENIDPAALLELESTTKGRGKLNATVSKKLKAVLKETFVD